MRTVSIRTLIALLLIALPVCWGEVFPGGATAGVDFIKIDLIAAVPETGRILLVGMALLTLASLMRVRTTR
jgi:hypothetical protein